MFARGRRDRAPYRARRPLCSAGQILYGASAGQAQCPDLQAHGRECREPQGGGRGRPKAGRPHRRCREMPLRAAVPRTISLRGGKAIFDKLARQAPPPSTVSGRLSTVAVRGALLFAAVSRRGLTSACAHGSAEPCYSARNAGRRLGACRGAASAQTGSAAPEKKLQETLR